MCLIKALEGTRKMVGILEDLRLREAFGRVEVLFWGVLLDPSPPASGIWPVMSTSQKQRSALFFT